MSPLYEKVKDALRKKVAVEHIAAIFGISECLVRKVKDRMEETGEA